MLTKDFVLCVHVHKANEKELFSNYRYLRQCTTVNIQWGFSTVHHNILLYKLEHYGFRGIALDWFRNYLSGRTQIVQFKLTSSVYLTIKRGVPQGSVLGPLLF